eukprot:jgi/Galph1/1763/GphlegSOOS_G443.1
MVVNTKETEQKLRGRLVQLYKQTPCMPIMVRIAWHDAGTHDVNTKTGGVNGSVRFDVEQKHKANAGLKNRFKSVGTYQKVSYADLFQLGSVVAIEYAGGPKIPFRMGRKDADGPDKCPEEGRLPDAEHKLPQLRKVFYRMGLNDKELTVLSGGHTLGRAHKDRSGYEGPWTKSPLVFDNSYFVEILKEKPDPELLRLASDLALLEDPNTKKLVEAYAQDKELFFRDYVEAHKKLSELGAEWVQ